VFWVTAIFVRGRGGYHQTAVRSDWDFWTDWKDPQWWPVITAFATIIIPSALQYIQCGVRFPTVRTYTSVCFFLAAWVGGYFSGMCRRATDELRVAISTVFAGSSWTGR